MGKFGRKLTDAFKKAVGVSSSRSHETSSVRNIEPEESPMHEDKEMVPMEEEEQEQEQPMEVEDDVPYLDLEGD